MRPRTDERVPGASMYDDPHYDRAYDPHYLTYDPRDPAPAPLPWWKRAAVVLAGHLAQTALRGAAVLVLAEILMPFRAEILFHLRGAL